MARCMFPYMVERKIFFNQGDRLVPVPCGKCPNCLKRRLASWSFRLEMESLRWPKQFFVTLTYDTQFVPITNNSFMSLRPKDVTDFLKRLRKRSGKLKYYLCGEYGTRGKRPHYHLILFGNDALNESDIVNSWRDVSTGFDIGNVYFGKVEAASIRYTVQYFDKGVWCASHSRDDREPEFSRMSEGIGLNWLTPEIVQHFLADPSKGFIYDREGRKISIPPYYKRRMFDYFSTDMVVASNPSILVHRDEMVEAKRVHHEAIAAVMASLPPEEEDSFERNEGRRAAISNYRASKRKSRK